MQHGWISCSKCYVKAARYKRMYCVFLFTWSSKTGIINVGGNGGQNSDDHLGGGFWLEENKKETQGCWKYFTSLAKVVTQGVNFLYLCLVSSGPSGLSLTRPYPGCHCTMFYLSQRLCESVLAERGAATPAHTKLGTLPVETKMRQRWGNEAVTAAAWTLHWARSQDPVSREGQANLGKCLNWVCHIFVTGNCRSHNLIRAGQLRAQILQEWSLWLYQ